MRKHRVLRVIGCVVGAIVVILLYEMIGIFAAYKKQPELSEETKQSLHPEDIYTDATVEERACIIEENGDALLQRVRPGYRPTCLCLFIRHINKQLRLQAVSLLICMTELFSTNNQSAML